MTEAQIKKHKIAAEKLDAIKNRAFSFIRKNINKATEYQVNKFILAEFKKEGMITQKEYPAQIVSFGKNTPFVHYYPKANSSKIIHKNNLILVDIWAKLNEKDVPFADITWMAYTGNNVPKEIKEAFGLICRVRKESIRFIEKELKSKHLPGSVEIENSARDYLRKLNKEKYFLHGLGHSLGITQDHGTYFRFSKKSKSRLKLNIPFTIEPGLYFKNRFGVRSEINCYVTEDYRLVITTRIQNKIVNI